MPFEAAYFAGIAEVTFVACLLLAASAVGSFVATCVSRSARNRPLFWPARSACPVCGSAVPVWGLIPIIGFFLARGRCGHCGARIEWFNPVCETLALLIGVSILWSLGARPTPVFLAGAAFATALLFLAFHDIRTGLLPDLVTVPLLGLGLIYAALWGSLTFEQSLAGAAAGGGFSFLTALLYKRFRGRDGLGLGDVKLIAAIGAWIGWQLLPHMIVFASALGIAALIITQLRSGNLLKNDRIVFGPFLCISGWALWLIAQQP